MSKAQQRVWWLDILRIVSMIGVVMLHTFTGNFLGNDSAWRTLAPDTAAWQILNVLDCLLRACVPLFCMISGVFFLDPEKQRNPRSIFSKNILRLGVAFLFWTVIYAVAGAFLRGESLNGSTLVGMVKNAAVGHYHMWFIPMLIGLYLLVPLIRKITASRRACAYLLVLGLVFVFLKNAALLVGPLASFVAVWSDAFDLQMVGGFLTYFVLGSYLYRFPPKTWVRHLIYVCGVAAFVLTAVAVGIGGAKGVKDSALYGYLLPNTLAEAAAVFLFCRERLENRTVSPRAQTAITLLSACSFGVYLTHDLWNMFLRSFGVSVLWTTPFITVPLMTAVVYVLSLCTVLLLRHIPLCKKYVL